MKKGETGVTFRANASFDMSSNTELSIVFIKPSGTTLTKTSANGVTIGSVAVTDADLGSLTANEYIEYETEDIFDESGVWKAYCIYDNSGASPADHFISDTITFTVYDPAKITPT